MVVPHEFRFESSGHAACSCGHRSPQRFGTQARAMEWFRAHKREARRG